MRDGWGCYNFKMVKVYYTIPVLPGGGGVGIKLQTRPDQICYMKAIREWSRAVLIQRMWKSYKNKNQKNTKTQ